MLSDLRFALRMLFKHRWFSAAVIATIALGIGINTTVFTLVNAVLFKPVDVPRGERLVAVSGQDLTVTDRRTRLSFPDFEEFKANQTTFEYFEAVRTDGAVISEPGIPAGRYDLGVATWGTFSMLSTPPILGRPFTAADGKTGAERVVMLGHKIWQERYAGSSAVLGQTIRLNEEPATIVGVMPEGFMFPFTQEIWTVLTPTEQLQDRSQRSIQGFAVLAEGVSLAQAQEELSVISQRLMQEFPETNKDRGVLVQTFHSAFNGEEIRMVFLMMLGAVFFVLLIACANIANMLLGRALTRTREISIRAALGATRKQIIRQLLTESILLSCIGGLVGLGLSLIGVHLFDLATQNVGKPYWVTFEMDWRAFGYFALISIASGVIFGLMPALKASRADLNSALKDGTAAAGNARGSWLTGTLVVLQFALTVVLLAGAGMMVRSFFAVQTINPHIPAEQIFTGRVFPPGGKGQRYETQEQRQQFYQELRETYLATPGVEAAAFVSHFPGTGSSDRRIEISGRPVEDPKELPEAAMIIPTLGFFDLIDQPLLQGRFFDHTDGAEGREAAVVTREFAQKFWPDQSAIGEKFRLHNRDEPGAWMTIVGVCANLEHSPNEKDTLPLFFVPHRQDSWNWMGLMVRTSGDAATFASTARQILQDQDQDLPMFETATLEGAVERNLWFLKVFGTLFFVFALIALLMASVGIYGVVSQTTAQRTREIGIRMALGATSGGVIRLVVGGGMRQLAIGLVLGLGGAFAATGLLEQVGFLVGTSADDPKVFIAVATMLTAIGLIACWLPARRAARVNPVKALHSD
ncbi:MAG: ABC transporter permease [Synoicihabitans sp.]